LGMIEHQQLDSLALGLRRAVPVGQIRAALPALWHNNNLFAAPFYGIGNEIMRCVIVVGG
jgi:hypothetical protein